MTVRRATHRALLLLPVWPVLLAIVVGTVVGSACRTRPLALGEALVVVTTDAAIPKHVGHLRVDIYRDDGSLPDSRDIVAARPEDWPVSFSVIADREEMRSATVRLRAYAEGHLLTHADAIRDGGTEPTIAISIDEACANAPTLALGTPITQRRGETPITSVLPFATDAGASCSGATNAGSVVARVVVPEADRYRFSIVRATPNGALGEPGGDTTLSLRGACGFPTSQIVCGDDIAPDAGHRVAAIDRVLDAGTYWLVTGGAEAATADLTLLGVRGNAGEVPSAATPVDPLASALEPNAAVTIDRLVIVDLLQGYRGTVPVVLHGECFGTPADLAEKRSCVDTTGARVAVDPVIADGDLKPTLPSPPPWSAETDDTCSVAARPSSPLHDDEVCVPGGAFLMGDSLDLTDLDFRTQPEHMRAVEPFLLDRFEFTVGRYRAAVLAGLAETSGDPFVHEASRGDVCTYRGKDKPDDDAYPLNCVSFARARALCNFVGSELPTEDQWEYAASAAGRPAETQYPWGDPLPDCARSAVERSDAGAANQCASAAGPVPVDQFGDTTTGDVTALGLHGLGGNVQEWLLDGFFPYNHVVWTGAGLRGALAPDVNATAPLQATRGGGWASFLLFATASARRALPPLGRYDNAGFRCARAGR